MRFVVAIRRLFFVVVDFLDKRSGAITALATVAIVVLTFVYVTYSKKQWQTMQDSNQIARDAGARPFLGLAEENAIRADPLTIDAKGNVIAECVVTAKNYGTYPAQNVLPFCELLVLQGSITPVHDRIRQFCEEGWPAIGGSVLFQGRTNPWKWNAFVANSQFIRTGNDTTFFVFLVGCVRYRDRFKVDHCTAFAFKRNYVGTINTVSFEPTPNTTVPGEWVEWDGVVDPSK